MAYRRGSRGGAVRTIQTKLKATVATAIKVDGIFGPITEQAVRKFQRSRGLQVDGIVGAKTWQALISGSSGGSGGSGGSGSGGLPLKSGMHTIVGGILLYGIFKVLMKVF
jgi:peptidoglycan hydrolase-like protein with peptidoglycan-binding domain